MFNLAEWVRSYVATLAERTGGAGDPDLEPSLGWPDAVFDQSQPHAGCADDRELDLSDYEPGSS